jgi:hypothetical protein
MSQIIEFCIINDNVLKKYIVDIDIFRNFLKNIEDMNIGYIYEMQKNMESNIFAAKDDLHNIIENGYMEKYLTNPNIYNQTKLETVLNDIILLSIGYKNIKKMLSDKSNNFIEPDLDILKYSIEYIDYIKNDTTKIKMLYSYIDHNRNNWNNKNVTELLITYILTKSYIFDVSVEQNILKNELKNIILDNRIYDLQLYIKNKLFRKKWLNYITSLIKNFLLNIQIEEYNTYYEIIDKERKLKQLKNILKIINEYK